MLTADAGIGWALGDLVDRAEVARRCGVSDTQVQRWVERAGFPQPLPCPGLRYRVWSGEAVANWLRLHDEGRR